MNPNRWVLVGALLLTAVRPDSAFARFLSVVWKPARRPGPSESRYRLHIAALWFLVAVIACAMGYAISAAGLMHGGRLGMTITFLATLLALVGMPTARRR
jgi:small-conductance mechanosensitive channel